MCTKSKKVPAFFWSVLRYYIPSFKKKNEKLHKRATVYSCFLHMCFLWVIFIPNLHPFPNVVVHDALYKIKKTASNAAFLGEGIFTMGYSKNYIMYWGGFYGYYNTMDSRISVHKVEKSSCVFLVSSTVLYS